MGKANPSVYASGSGHSLYATVTWGSGPDVTVNVSSTSSWKMVPRGSSGHSGILNSPYATDSYSNTFTATDGGQYVFQIYCPVEGTYYNQDFATSGFTVNFGDDSGGDPGGDSGGGGGTSGGTYRFYYSAGEGTFLEVRRRWSVSLNKDEDKPINSGTTIFWNDWFDVTFDELDGYEDINLELDNYRYDDSQTTYHEDGKISYRGTMATEGDITVTTSATPKQYKLTISEGAGSNLTVTRIASNHNSGSSGQLFNGSAIYHDDKLQITCDADTGYENPSIKIGNTTLSNGGEYVVSGNTTVTSSASVKSYTLTLNAEDPGVTIAVSRTRSPLKGAANKTWTKYEEEASYDDIYYGDVLTITFTSDPEYKINNQQVNGEYFISGGTHTVADDVYIVAITELSGVVHIFNGSQFDNYLIYVFNGSTWDQYIPYVYDGTKWSICS